MLQEPAALVLQPVIQRIVRHKAFCFTRGLQAADPDGIIRPHLTGAAERCAQCIRQREIRLAQEGSIITLDAPSFVPFMKYCDDRSLRREVYMAYNTQCTHNNEYNNVDIIKQLVNIRMELAHLLGFFINYWGKGTFFIW